MERVVSSRNSRRKWSGSVNESTQKPTIPLWMDITFTVFVLAWIFITISALAWLLFGRPPRDSRSRT